MGLSMPKNRFPDSLEKRELRRRDARRLGQFRNAHGPANGLAYCGMPSVEFLDVHAWRGELSSVHAVEFTEDVLEDMRIEWDRLDLDLNIVFDGPTNILQFLVETKSIFDVYNLDFYGGLIYPSRGKVKLKCVDAISALLARHSLARRSFVLITTLNVRDKGAEEYLQYLSKIPPVLKGWKNVKKCCDEHKENQARRLKICFPFFCWQTGIAHRFNVSIADPIVYESSATMVHFYMEFYWMGQLLPEIGTQEAVADLANRPLLRMKKMLPVPDLRPTQIFREPPPE
jgi:hypothetical protein